MNRQRMGLVLKNDLRFHLTRPLFWVLVALLALVSFGLSSGNLSISSGDSAVGGQQQAWITSEFAIGQMLPLVTFLFYSFFIAVAAGMAIPQDDELGVGPVLHATKLQPKEYIWGKFGAAFLVFCLILVAHVAFTILFNQIVPNPRADLIRGPFEWLNYLRPTLFLAFPFVVFLCGVSFAVGEYTRKPILVFVAPTAFFLISIFFLWSWSPSWLDPRINQILGLIEPSGFRWLNETWLKIDLGVDVYNHQPIGYDLPFLLSRLAYMVLGIGLVIASSRHFARSLAGEQKAKRSWLPWRRKANEQATVSQAPVDALGELLRRPLAALGMVSTAPSFFATMKDVTRFETRNLLHQPGLYIFVPLILLQTIGTLSFQVGAFDTPMLLTPGIAAVGSMNTLTLLVCLLVLFYCTESVSREWNTRLAPIFYATPAKLGAILTGKTLATSLVALFILLATYVGAASVMLFQGKVAPSVIPFLLVWGLLLLPTFIAWTCFVMAALALTGHRLATYGIGLAAMAFTGWKQSQGEINWVGNWNLWSAVTWTDFGGLDPNTSALVLNRVFWLLIAAFLVALTVRIFPRRAHDSGRVVDRLHPKNIFHSIWKLSPAALPALVVGITLGVQVSQGFQGQAVERRDEEYRGRNLITWGEAELPRLRRVDIDLDLEPDEKRMTVEGTLVLENQSTSLVRRFPMSTGDHFENLKWTLEGEIFEPENWAKMFVFVLPEPLNPGDRVEVGFSFEGSFPTGISRNGGGLGRFVLPSGVVLTSFGSDFLPVPYFEGGRGDDEDNRLEPRSYEEGFHEGLTPPAFGGGSRYHVRTKISGPERFAYHGVGVRESEQVEDGRRTVVWETDHPVNFFNVVAGEWDVWEGEGVAIYHHAEHVYNLEEMGEALEASRRYYSEWFYPYPWQELKVSEFPGLASYAQGFPTNITFAESIGFLTRSTPEARVAFLVTAHEAAHQWWGNILLPGAGPGGNILSEGMAHFSTLLLYEQVKGVGERIEFCKRIEESYGDQRRVDGERALVWTDGSKTGDTTVTYDKGGWVAWMLMQQMGRETMLAGLQDFIGRYVTSNDYPVLQDMIAVLREHSADPEAFDAFVDQWFFNVVMPQYRLSDTRVEQQGGEWVVTAKVENVGTGHMPVEVAVSRGERFPAADEDAGEAYQEQRAQIVLGAEDSKVVTIRAPFEPQEIVVDPDALVLQLNRAQGRVEL